MNKSFFRHDFLCLAFMAATGILTMPMTRRIGLALAFFIIWVVMCEPNMHAADVAGEIYGVYNEAGLDSPADVVAPGSNVLIFLGSFSVGPTVPQTSAGFPLVTTLAGVSVKATVSGVSVDAYVLGAQTQWVRAMLPSNTPIGDGQLAVTYNGRSSAPYRLTVRERAFWIYDGSSCGPTSFPSVPGFCVGRAVQNIDPAGIVSANSLALPARPGQLVTLWGSGLGAASGNEGAGPIPDALQIAGLRVLFGGQPARIIYSGRSGCCAGMDEIIFEVPSGIEGCKVPLWVRYSNDGASSNDVYLSVASGTGACSDPHGLSEGEARKLSEGNIKAAEIWAGPRPDGGGSLSAAFGTPSQTAVIPFGSCGNIWGGEGFPALTQTRPLFDAGAALNLYAPRGTFIAARFENGFYDGSLDGVPESGEYQLDNGEGGPDVGPFQAKFSVPDSAFVWTNRGDLGGVNRDGLVITWNVADATAGHVTVVGNLAMDGETSGSTVFTCAERADKGSFRIPPSVLERAGVWSGQYNEFYLNVGFRAAKRLTIPGLDFAEFLVFGPGQSTLLDPASIQPVEALTKKGPQ